MLEANAKARPCAGSRVREEHPHLKALLHCFRTPEPHLSQGNQRLEIKPLGGCLRSCARSPSLFREPQRHACRQCQARPRPPRVHKAAGRPDHSSSVREAAGVVLNKRKFGLRSPNSTFAVLQRPTIERPVDGSWRVLFRCWWSPPTCPGRSVKIRIAFLCVHEHRRWPSGVFMNNAPLGRSVFLAD